MALDELLSAYLKREEGVRQLGVQIANGGRPTVVVFLDLAGSTQLKQDADPAVWLGYIHRFFETIGSRLGNGRIVKRIGDELMITFDDVEECEDFLSTLHDDTFFHDFPSRIAVDYGVCYHLQFAEGAADDPYGETADRCARIVGLARAGSVICSEHFVAKSKRRDRYQDLGSHSLVGIPNLCGLYLYHPSNPEASAAYLAPLLEKLAEPDIQYEGYRWASRRITQSALQPEYPSRGARPFLLRELLRIPKLPYDPLTLFRQIAESHLPNAGHAYIGYLVEWSGTLQSFIETPKTYVANIEVTWEGLLPPWLYVSLSAEMYEAVREIPKGQLVRVRGIITALDSRTAEIDYADIALD